MPKSEFEKYIKRLAEHEIEKSKLGPREKILVYAGVHLNWIGDYLANPKIKYRKLVLPTKKILFSGTSPDWNKILIDKCGRRVENFQKLIARDPKMKSKFAKEAVYDNTPILVRGRDEKGYYRVVDGMHRFVAAVMQKKKSISAYAPVKKNYLPYCEAHVIYDLIRGYARHTKDRKGEKELYYALKLLARTYGNVAELLKNRFGKKYLSDKNVQKIIQKVLKKK